MAIKTGQLPTSSFQMHTLPGDCINLTEYLLVRAIKTVSPNGDANTAEISYRVFVREAEKLAESGYHYRAGAKYLIAAEIADEFGLDGLLRTKRDEAAWNAFRSFVRANDYVNAAATAIAFDLRTTERHPRKDKTLDSTLFKLILNSELSRIDKRRIFRFVVGEFERRGMTKEAEGFGLRFNDYYVYTLMPERVRARRTQKIETEKTDRIEKNRIMLAMRSNRNNGGPKIESVQRVLELVTKPKTDSALIGVSRELTPIDSARFSDAFEELLRDGSIVHTEGYFEVPRGK